MGNLNLKNFREYSPKDKKFGDDIAYLISDDGMDWYDCQSQFSEETLKVVYGDGGEIISVSSDVSTLFPLNASVIELEATEEQVSGKYIKDGKLVNPPPTSSHKWESKNGEWTITKKALAEITQKNREEVREQINLKRDICVNGGVYVESIDKWVDTDEKARLTLIEMQTDFAINGEDSKYTLICADNSTLEIDFDKFKSIWNAVKLLKESMYENAYMHEVLVDESQNPLSYDWSIGWSKTYNEHSSEVV